jgi:hypothetical protein
MRQARHDSGLDRADPYPLDGYCAGGCAGGQRNRVANGNDHLRVAAGDLASEIGKALGPTLAGIPLYDQVLSLDIAQPAQLFEKRLVEPAT